MTEQHKRALDHYVNQIEAWNWLGIMREPDQETLMNIRTQFQLMIELLDDLIEQKPA